MAKKQLRLAASEEKQESLVRIFFRGFFMPLRFIWRGIVWASHQPPLKQIGHGVRWFSRLRAVRFIARVLGLRYLYRSTAELKGVTWPTFRESLRLTSAVIIFSIIFGIFVTVVDYGLDKLFKEVLLK